MPHCPSTEEHHIKPYFMQLKACNVCMAQCSAVSVRGKHRNTQLAMQNLLLTATLAGCARYCWGKNVT